MLRLLLHAPCASFVEELLVVGMTGPPCLAVSVVAGIIAVVVFLVRNHHRPNFESIRCVESWPASARLAGVLVSTSATHIVKVLIYRP